MPFNADMPYNEFTIRQLAGDLLEKPDLVATAFHRNTWTNTEGGTDDEEYRVAAVMDRVNTTWTAWQATTFGCTRCHAHPYDPIPQVDYYRFMAFFNSTEDVDVDNEFPLVKATNDLKKQAECDALAMQAKAKRHALNAKGNEIVSQVKSWQMLHATELKPSADTGTLKQDAQGIVLAGGTNPTKSSYTLRFPASEVTGLRLRILPLSDDPKQWLELASVVSQFTLNAISPTGEKRNIPLAEVIADYLAGPYDPQESLTENGDGFGPFPSMQGPRWAVFVPKEKYAPKPGEVLEVVIAHKVTCNGNNQPSILRKFSLEATADPALTAFVSDAARIKAWDEWRKLQHQADSIPGTKLPGLLQLASDASRSTRLFIRGNRMTRDEEVSAGIPAVSRPPAKEKMNRLDMAQWLVSDQNTLSARVLANRLWAELFGIGIVETQEDFGSSGVPPTHPELLDHLALRLSKQYHWHIKPFLKDLLLSAAYGQTSKATPALAAADGPNRLLARGPRTRLTAEMVRDQNLLVSGLLSRKTAGPPVFPPQPDGVWRTVYNGAKWETSKGEDRYRRSVYTYWKRTSAYPSFLTFDMSARDNCSARRIPTNTPLQALVTLNDPAYLEMAQAFAKKIAAASNDLPGQLRFAHERLLLTTPTPATMSILTSLYEDSVKQFKADPAASAKIASNPAEAALVVLANTLMNADSALSK